MFRFEDKLPPYLVNNSRDFLLMSRLDDLLFMGIRSDVRGVQCLNDPAHCHSEVLDLLAHKVGFFYTGYIPQDILKRIVSSFKSIMNYKGTLVGIKMAVTCIQGKNDNVNVIYEPDVVKQTGVEEPSYLTNTIDIYAKEPIVDKHALNQLLKYVLPTGICYNTYTRTYEEYYKYEFDSTQKSYIVYVSKLDSDEECVSSDKVLSIQYPEPVPTVYNGRPVYKIKDNAFHSCSIELLLIPTGMELGTTILNNCTRIKKLTLPSSVTVPSLFSSVPSSLKEVTVTSSADKTVADAFMKNCPYVQVVTMDEGITSVGASAFNGCTELHTVKFSPSITSIGNFAFEGCNNLRVIDLTEIKNCPTFGTNCFGEWSANVVIKAPISWYWEAMEQNNFKYYNGRIYCESVEKQNTLYIGNYILVEKGTNKVTLGVADADFNDASYELIAGYNALVTTKSEEE